MSVTSTDESDGHLRVELPSALDLRIAQALKSALLEALAKAKPLRIDAASVERMSTACIQILIAFAEAARQAGLSVAFHRPSASFMSAFDNLGLSPVTAHWKLEH